MNLIMKIVVLVCSSIVATYFMLLTTCGLNDSSVYVLLFGTKNVGIAKSTTTTTIHHQVCQQNIQHISYRALYP